MYMCATIGCIYAVWRTHIHFPINIDTCNIFVICIYSLVCS